MISFRYHGGQGGSNAQGHLMEESRVAMLIRIRRTLKARLVQLAKREHRSVNREIEFLLEKVLTNQESDRSESQSAPAERPKR